MSATLDPRKVTAERICAGLERGEFVPYFQPVVSLADGTVTSVEALVRWEHPDCGLLLPGTFLPVAETHDLLADFGSMILRKSALVAHRFRSRRGEPVKIWINLAAQQNDQPEVLLNDVRAAVQEYDLDPRQFGFEVTESGLIADLNSATSALGELRDIGFDLAIDDFGTGYASLTYLRRLPATIVKIDRSFVGAVDGSLADAAIVQAVTELSHALGLKVVAEGVETFEQLDGINRLGVDAVQGFYFSRALSPDELIPVVAKRWCGQQGFGFSRVDRDVRADALPGAGSPRAQLLMSVLDVSPDSVMVLEGPLSCRPLGPRILYVNRAFEIETGYRAAEVFGRRTSMLDAATADPSALGRMADAMDACESVTVEVRNQRANGTEFQCEITLSPILDERGKASFWLEVRRDRTEAYAAEHRRRSEFLRQLALDDVVLNASRLALELSPDEFLAALPDALRVVGEVLGAEVMYVEEVANNRFSPIAHWCAPHVSQDAAGFEDDGESFPEWRRLLESGQPQVIDDVNALDNAKLLAEIFLLPVPDRAILAIPFGIAGSQTGTIGATMVNSPRHWLPDEIAVMRKLADTFAQAIDRQRAQGQLRETQARLGALVTDGYTGLVIIDRRGVCVFANRSAAEIVGIDVDELVGSAMADFVHPSDSEVMTQAFASAFDFGGVERRQVRLKHVSGGYVWAEVGSSRASGVDVGGIVMTARPLGGWPAVPSETLMASVTVVVQAAWGVSSEISADDLRAEAERAILAAVGSSLRVGSLPVAVSARVENASEAPDARPKSSNLRSTFSR